MEDFASGDDTPATVESTAPVVESLIEEGAERHCFLCMAETRVQPVQIGGTKQYATVLAELLSLFENCAGVAPGQYSFVSEYLHSYFEEHVRPFFSYDGHAPLPEWTKSSIRDHLTKHAGAVETDAVTDRSLMRRRKRRYLVQDLHVQTEMIETLVRTGKQNGTVLLSHMKLIDSLIKTRQGTLAALEQAYVE